MIWHMYDNNDKAFDRVIIKEEQPHLHYTQSQQQQQQQKRSHYTVQKQQQQQQQQQKQYTPSLSSAEDVHMQTDDDEENDYSAGEESDTTTNTANIKSTTKAKNINSKMLMSNNPSLFLNFTSDLSPHQPNKKKKKKTILNNQASYKVNGVNILNRKNLDSKTVIERIQKRRENHNYVERRRRDCINNTILELSQIVPNASLPGQKLNKGNVLKLALDYILYVQSENASMKNQLNQLLDSGRESSSVQNSPYNNNLIGNTSSYHQGYENRPMFRSTSGESSGHQITLPMMHNDQHQQQSIMTTTATVAAISSPASQMSSLPTMNKTHLLRPILPAINSNDNSASGEIVLPSQQSLQSPLAMHHQQPQQLEQHYSNPFSRCTANNSSYHHHLPPSSFIYNESYYRNTCRFL